jgi:hypothetical protein
VGIISSMGQDGQVACGRTGSWILAYKHALLLAMACW